MSSNFDDPAPIFVLVNPRFCEYSFLGMLSKMIVQLTELYGLDVSVSRLVFISEYMCLLSGSKALTNFSNFDHKLHNSNWMFSRGDTRPGL